MLRLNDGLNHGMNLGMNPGPNPALSAFGCAAVGLALLLALPAGAQTATPPAAAPAASAPAPAAAPASPAAPASVPVSSGVGQITHLSGTLVGRMEGQTQPRLLANRSSISPGETLATQGDTYARVKFNDGTEVVLRPNTQFKIEQYTYDEKEPSKDNIVFGLIKGGLRSVSGLISKRNKEKIQYTTATATVGIRGTHFGMLMCSADCAGIPTVTGTMPADGLHVDVAAGQIVVTTPAGALTVNPGQFGYVPSAGAAPTIVPPQNGIRVTMPAVIANNNSGGRTVGNPNAGQDQCRP
jgi:FecR protein